MSLYDQNHNILGIPLIPYYRTSYSLHRIKCCCLIFTSIFLLLAAAAFVFYPSDPTIQLARLRLNYFEILTTPKLKLDLSFSLTFKVHNADFFSMDYNSLAVTVGYRGTELGVANWKGGRVRARTTSYVDTELELDGLEVAHDVIYMVSDVARGVIPFEIGVLFFGIPTKGKVSCDIYVHIRNQTIARQDCYPEVRGSYVFTVSRNDLSPLRARQVFEYPE